MDVMHFNGVAGVETAMFAGTDFMTHRSRFLSAEMTGIFVTALIAMTIAVSGVGGELAPLVLRIFMEVDVAKVHLR